MRGSAVTFLKDEGEQKCPETADSCGGICVDLSSMVFDTWRGLHCARKEVVKADLSRCTGDSFPEPGPLRWVP